MPTSSGARRRPLDLAEAERFATAIHERHPGKLLAYNCSPSFNWRGHLIGRPDRRVPARARRDRMPLPVHHPRRLPRPQPLDVQAGFADTAPRRCPRTSSWQEARVRVAGSRLYRDPPSTRGRRRLLRPGDAGRVGAGTRRRSPYPARRRSNSSLQRGAQHEPDDAHPREACQARRPPLRSRLLAPALRSSRTLSSRPAPVPSTASATTSTTSAPPGSSPTATTIVKGRRVPRCIDRRVGGRAGALVVEGSA